MQRAGLAEVFEAVANAQDGGQKVSLLIGAGCSVTAGIPVASGIVERIAKLFPAVGCSCQRHNKRRGT